MVIFVITLLAQLQSTVVTIQRGTARLGALLGSGHGALLGAAEPPQAGKRQSPCSLSPWTKSWPRLEAMEYGLVGCEVVQYAFTVSCVGRDGLSFFYIRGNYL